MPNRLSGKGVPRPVGADARAARTSPKAVRNGSAHAFLYSERHVQALWFDDSLRPQSLKDDRGEPVEVESPGQWNVEAGPDFRGAILRVGPEHRRVVGDVEVHISPKDWRRHGHHTDRRYQGVCVHVMWFAGAVDPSLFPAGTIHLSLCDCCSIDFERLDLSAYPHHAPRASNDFVLADLEPDAIVQFLERAGAERLQKKAHRLARLIEQRGAPQILYEEVAAALGYKNNARAFRQLAHRVSLFSLVRYGTRWEAIDAVLLGVSGWLPAQPEADWSAEAKAHLRSLWDLWWRESQRWNSNLRMSAADWDRSGLRPFNHPVRRLCALAQYVASGFFEQVGESFPPLRPCFWSTHLSWARAVRSTELIGAGRLAAMTLNALVPYRLAMGEGVALDRLRVEPINRVIRQSAYTLLGPDHSPRLYRSALARQGLIQIFNDFILTGRLDALRSRE